MSAEDDSTVYEQVYHVLASQPSRQAGGDAFQAAVTKIAAVCRQHGLDVKRQPYATLVPVTKHCELRLGQRRIEALPLAPNSDIMLTASDGQVLNGPCYFVGNGSIEEMNGLPLRGALAVMYLGSPHMQDLFSEGVRAVILVEHPDADRWNSASHFTAGRQNLPRAFVSAAAAKDGGLLTAHGEQASLHIETVWEDRITENLVITAAADDPQEFTYQRQEQIILSATLDTSGIVPDLCPDYRRAANVALLVETLCSLPEQRQRDVIGVLWGSHHYAQEGARHFYFARHLAQPDHDYADSRHLDAYYVEELGELRQLATLIARDDCLQQQDDPAFPLLRKVLRERLTSIINELNFLVQQYNLVLHEHSDDTVAALLQQEETYRARLKELYGHITDMETEDLTRIHGEYAVEYAHIRQQARVQLTQHIMQLEALQSQLQSTVDLAAMFENKQVILHLEFDFSNSQQPVLPNIYGDYGNYYKDPQSQIKPGLLVRHTGRLETAFKQGWSAEMGPRLLVDMYRNGMLATRLCTPFALPLNTEVAVASNVYGYHLQNIAAPLSQDAMPKQDHCQLQGLLPFTRHMLQRFCNEAALSLKCNLTGMRPQHKYLHQSFIRRQVRGASEIDGPAVDAVCAITGRRNNLQINTGFSRSAICRAIGDGSFFAPMMSRESSNTISAVLFDDQGVLTHISGAGSGFRNDVFYAYGGGMFTPYTPDNFDLVLSTWVYSGHSNSKYQTLYDNHNRDERVYYANRDKNFKTVDSAGLFLLNESGDPDDDYYGVGFELDPETMRTLNTVQQSAADYQKINTRRLNTLRNNNISVQSIEHLHSAAQYHISDGHKARQDQQTAAARKHETLGLALSNRVYKPLKQVPKDLTSAIVILLLLSIPFAFSLERLLFGFTTIQKQIFGFLFFFIGTFLILYAVHPAFSISTTPSVIFLAFVIVIMSGMVIKIIISKFKFELMSMQGLTSQSHSAERHSSVGLASVLIGISSMRNRPLKTALTALTIVLLTFTVLVFGSFNAQQEVVTTHIGNAVGPSYVQITRNALLQIPARLREALHHEYADRFTIYERSALFHDLVSYRDRYNTSVPVVKNSDGSHYPSTALLGLDQQEFDQDPMLRDMTPGSLRRGTVYLSPEAARQLQMEPGEQLSIWGHSFTFGGAFNEERLKSARYIDNKQLLPPDYQATIAELTGSRGSVTLINDQMNTFDASSFRWTSPDLTVLMHKDDVLALGGCVNAICMYPHADTDLASISGELAQYFPDPVFARHGDGDYQYFYTTSYQGSGFSDILIPLLLGGLIIFSSLLGSIVDREREIYTFSALGLAPPNVAALFFAESSVYAVIGGLGGYLISQAVATGLTWLSQHGIYEAPEMNFSSLSSVYTIVLVMLIVLLSTIYPAVKAGRSANPGINRKWKMPDPVDDQLEFLFPFTISTVSLVGICSFIAEHFENHSDASLGLFAASEVAVERIGTDDYRLAAHISLSPFDLGIAQLFELYSSDSEIEGIKEIHIRLKRDSGSPDAWLRSNRRFLGDLRHQFLLWRSLPVETIEFYCSRTRDITD